MKRGHAWAAGLALGLAAGITATGCGTGQTERSDSRAAARATQGEASQAPWSVAPQSGLPPGVGASAPPTASAAGTSPTGTATGTAPTASAAGQTAGGHVLPGACEDVLTAAEVDQALGRHLGGHTRLIRGVAEPHISRTGRLTCRYGVAPTTGRGPATVPVELGLSTYAEPEAASQRVDYTVHQEQTRGAHQSALRVLDRAAVLLSGGRDDPLLVLADGDLTLALTVAHGVAPDDRAADVLAALAESVLRHLT